MDKTEKIVTGTASALIILAALAWGVSSTLKPEITKRSNTQKCLNNLKMIGLSMLIYADDNESWLPNANGAPGLSKTLRYGCGPKVFFCPATKSRYAYRGGLHLPSIDNPSETPLAWEQGFPHDGIKNVVFVDGHCESLSPERWKAVVGNTRKRMAAKKSEKRSWNEGKGE
jgi:prepilin-type processing-associated H-X9-DG protein